MDHQPRHIHNLADELLSEILSFLLGPESKAANGSKPHSNSSPAMEPGETSDLDRFRLVCKRFMRIGSPRKFSRFVLRFSRDGFQRLEDLLDMQLACYVKTVTYMVRPFYQGSGWARVLQALSADMAPLSQIHSRRLRDQNDLIESGYDLWGLRRALPAFVSLQEIKLLRLQDAADDRLIDVLRDHNFRRSVQFDWEPACSRAVTNLGIALLDSKCNAIRFIGPQISPEATLRLLRAPSTTLTALGGRLTSLDINFHATTDITTTMADLSGVFHRFFGAAKNLIAIHLGFPNKTPLDLDLEALFHHIRWKTLRTLSLQGWRLDSDEIIALARRHRHQLRSFRLAGIYLRPGGRWRDVLSMLRTEMEQLDRLDLRDIDYTSHFDALATASGVEVFDDPETGTDGGIRPALPELLPPLSSLTLAARASPHSTEFLPDRDLAPTPTTTTLYAQHRRTSSTEILSLEKLRAMSADDVGDDGSHVRRDQLALWEAWVLSTSQHVSVLHNGHRS
ncbi:hypothetical protein N7510_007304 [Penicillium lagena]|uniref:uncharacterized protein n=1 Tax=Penicillium lagena TaxID=94218 RepID=UPI002541F722|nr:uncharacterized protein N7510_007304 [Penicillium lagena]KAJ5610585.1 hypothetical protein N7510_007304 [Penicillium lagena]